MGKAATGGFNFHVRILASNRIERRCDVMRAQRRGATAHNSKIFNVWSDDRYLFVLRQIQRQQAIVLAQHHTFNRCLIGYGLMIWFIQGQLLRHTDVIQ